VGVSDGRGCGVLRQHLRLSPTCSYRGEPAANVSELDPDDLVKFMRTEPHCLPPTVEHWVKLAGG